MNRSRTEFHIDIDPQLHSREALLRAAYDLAKIAFFRFERNNSSIRVWVQSKGTDIPAKQEILSQFFECAIENEIRIKLQGEFKTIRDILVAQAFQPCENLKDILNELHHE
jgi:His-Xaa-Ser system protein HxsD